MFYVYKITCIINGKFYFGKTENTNKRWQTHKSIAKHPGRKDYKLIHKAINKYGSDNFVLDVIEKFDNEEESFNKEIELIALYKCNVYRYGSQFGYNQTDGGEGLSGHYSSDKTRRKISAACSGEKNGFYGKTHTKDTKAIISEKAKGNTRWKGKHHTDNTKQLMSKRRAEKFELYSELNSGSNNPQAKLNDDNIIYYIFFDSQRPK